MLSRHWSYSYICMIWVCDIVHSAVRTGYSLASVENLAASGKEIGGKNQLFPWYSQYTYKEHTYFSIFQMNNQFCFQRLLFPANSLSFILIYDFLLCLCSVSLLPYALLYPLFLPLLSNDTNKRRLQSIPHPCFRKQYQEAFFQHVLSFHKEYLALGSGFLLYLPVQEARNFFPPYSQHEKCLVEH